MRSRSYKFTGKVVPPTAGTGPACNLESWEFPHFAVPPRSRCGPAYSNCVLSRASSNSSFKTLPPMHILPIPSFAAAMFPHHIYLFSTPSSSFHSFFLQCCCSMASVDRTCAKRQPERTAVTSGENMGRERFCFWGRPSL